MKVPVNDLLHRRVDYFVEMRSEYKDENEGKATSRFPSVHLLAPV